MVMMCNIVCTLLLTTAISSPLTPDENCTLADTCSGDDRSSMLQTRAHAAPQLELLEKGCQLGFSACSYNWYEQNWNGGSPTSYWSQYCGCCGGTQAQQDSCKTAWINQATTAAPTTVAPTSTQPFSVVLAPAAGTCSTIITDEQECRMAASIEGVSYGSAVAYPHQSGINLGCWTFTGSGKFQFNTATSSNFNGGWNGNVQPVCKVEATTTEAPTTEAPSTEAPTTEAPTTEAPTTEAPTMEADTEGCLVSRSAKDYVWVVHGDGTRNWISSPSTGCIAKGLIIPDVSVYTQRHGGTGEYSLDSSESTTACQLSACVAKTQVSKPKVTSTPCGFETSAKPYCATWSNAAGDQFDWSRKSGSTPTSRTGPSKAHSGNHYMYIEASFKKGGDTAILQSVSTTFHAGAWLSFQYHMYGPRIGTLKVVFKEPAAGPVIVWQRNGDLGNKWGLADIDLSPYACKTGVIQLHGIITHKCANFLGDIAIDEISLTPGSGSAPAPTSAPSTGKSGQSDFFDRIDTDNSKVVNRDEFKKAVQDGKVIVEPGKGGQAMQASPTTPSPTDRFNRVDSDNSKSISRDELKKALDAADVIVAVKP